MADDPVSQVAGITGVGADVAERLLEAANWDTEAAVNLHFSMGAPAAAEPAVPAFAGQARAAHDVEDIPSRRAVE